LEVDPMRNYLSKWFFLSLLILASIRPACAQTTVDFIAQPWVDYRDGEISVAFYRAPIAIAVDAIHVTTGLEIILPRETESRLLDLRLNRVPLEPAVRRLLFSIGFRNFALTYDAKGQPSRAVVLENRPDVRAVIGENSSVASQAAAAQPLTAEERETLQKELERWSDLTQEDRGRIEDRLKTLPPSDEREQLVKEYGRQILGIKN
jgi:hypothetical protein